MIKYLLFFLCALCVPFRFSIFPMSVLLASTKIEPPCDGEEYEKYSHELNEIYEKDQADRANFTQASEDQLLAMIKHDRVRRARVGEIFAKGCLKSARDYLNAATVFQHGEVPDHFYQTYIWAKKAFDMGFETAGIMAANGIDRYLMNTGRKQLYGGQAVTEPGKSNAERPCFCLWPIEPSFPDRKRGELKFQTKSQIHQWLKDLNKDRKGCIHAFCKVEAKPASQGSVPGIW